MANVTITIEGDVEEVVATLRGMAGRASEPITAAPTAAEGETAGEATAVTMMPEAGTEEGEPSESAAGSSGITWNASYVTTFWRNLSDTARQAMLRVSRSPNHTQKRAQLMHTLRLTQRELSGSLSSQGHSLNRLKRRRGNVDLPRPLIYDRTEDAYVLDSNFANALRELGMS
ncbi:MAG: hypothetical protein OXF79_18625 [Chloroflexi bacterium]|nr:hypothetical protein [Chloroflexota bacterium]